MLTRMNRTGIRHGIRLMSLMLIVSVVFPLLPVSADSGRTAAGELMNSLRAATGKIFGPSARPKQDFAPQQAMGPGERASQVRKLGLCTRKLTLYVGESELLMPLPTDDTGRIINGAGLNWSSSNPGVVQTTTWGSLKAVSAGDATVRIQAGTAQVEVQVQVMSGPRPKLTDAEWDEKHASDCSTTKGRGAGEGAGDSTVSRREALKDLVRPAMLHKTNASSPVFAPVAQREEGGGIDPLDGSSDTGIAASVASPLNAVGSPRLAPIELSTGSTTKTRNNLGNYNFSLVAPVLGLEGRGLDLNLALIYNSRVWSKDNDTYKMSFNYTKGWPAAGWSLGYGRIIENYDGLQNHLLVRGDGTRIPLVKQGDGTYASQDGTFIKYTPHGQTQADPGRLRFPGGTVMRFSLKNNRLLPFEVKSANGDLITIVYRTFNKQVPETDPNYFPGRWGIDFMTDTLGRVICFKYYGDADYPTDGTSAKPRGGLAAVTAPDFGGGERTMVELQYQNITLRYNFSAYLSPDDFTPESGSTVTVLRRISYPATGRGYLFEDYNSYGMIRSVSIRKNMTNSASGDGVETASTYYNYTDVSTQNGTLDDSPQFTERTEKWDGQTDADGNPVQSAVYRYSRSAPGNPTRLVTIQYPNGFSETTTLDDLDDGPLFGTAISTVQSQNGVQVRSANYTYTSTINGVQIGSITTSEGGRSARTEFDYGNYGRLINLREFDFNGTAQRTTHYEYVDDPAYIGADMLQLVREQAVYQGASTTQANLKAKVVYTYDDYGPGGANMLTYSPLPTNHDPDFNQTRSLRGNVTSTKRWAEFSPSETSYTRNTKYDIFGNPVEAEVGCCNVKTFQYGLSLYYSKPIAITDGRPGIAPFLTAQYSFDERTGLLLSETDPDGQSTGYAYDSAWRLRQTTSPTGAVVTTEFEKDDLGNDQPRYRARTVYSENGTLKTVTQRQWFDGSGRLVRQGVGTGDFPTALDMTAFTYDALGRPTRQSNPFAGDASGGGNPQYWTKTDYDALSRVTKVTLPDGQTVETTYLGAGVTATDQVGRQRYSETDGLGRIALVKEQNPASGALDWVTTYTYDALDNLTQSNQGGQIRAYKYDALSRLKEEQTPEAGRVQYTYTDFDAVATRTDARNVVTTYGYDTLNRPTSIAYATNGTTAAATRNVTIGYQANSPGKGAVSSVVQAGGAVPDQETYGYDGFGRLAQRVISIDGRTYTVGYGYNQLNQLTTLGYPSGKRVRYNHDQRGRLAGLDKVDAGGGLISRYVTGIDYRVSGQIERIGLGNGVTETYSYSDTRLQLTRQQVTSGVNSLMDLNYSYAAAAGDSGFNTRAGNSGQLTVVTAQPRSFVDGQDRDQKFTYDNAGRMVTASGWNKWRRTYEYDRWGNRTGVRNTQTGEQIQTVGIQLDEFGVRNNRISNVNGGPTYSYDASGNQTGDGVQSFVYDAENRLVSANNGASVFGFDTENRRVKKTVAGKTTHSIYVGSSVIAEYDNATGAVLAEYVPAGGRVIAREQGATVRYFHQDRLSTRLTTDATGAVVGSSSQMPFGTEASACGETDKRAFTAYERDAETGTDYALNRQYAPNVGRFMRPDPFAGSLDIANPQSFNRYAYVLNDPVNLADPLGLQGVPAGTGLSDDVLNRIKKGIKTCKEKFGKQDPESLLQELLDRKGIQVNEFVSHEEVKSRTLSNGSVRTYSDRSTRAFRTYNNSQMIAAATTQGYFDAKTGTTRATITINPDGPFFLKEVPGILQKHTKDVTTYQAALIIHELLHAAKIFGDDGDDLKKSLGYTEEVLRDCFGQTPKPAPGVSDLGGTSPGIGGYYSDYGVLSALIFAYSVEAIPVGYE